MPGNLISLPGAFGPAKFYFARFHSASFPLSLSLFFPFLAAAAVKRALAFSRWEKRSALSASFQSA
jgi:hypothetical protein